MADYTLIDRSSLLQYLFYPRKEYREPPPGAFDLDISVDGGVSISCRAYPANGGAPWILFFHGNGEVVCDYDGIAPLYNRAGLSLLVADYRGYGASGGEPTFTALVRDAAVILETVRAGLPERGFDPAPLWVMGRSLGSISALELAYRHPAALRGLIIESGFISVVRLIEHLGLPSPGDLSALEREHRARARAVTLPALILHGEEDRLVPLAQGRELFDSLGSPQKEIVTIPGAGHNDIMFRGLKEYLAAIQRFTGTGNF